MTIEGNYFGTKPVHIAGGLKIGSSATGANFAGEIGGKKVNSGKELIPAETLKAIANNAVTALIQILEKPDRNLGETPKIILEISYPSEDKGNGKFVAKIPEIIPGAKPDDVVDIKAALYKALKVEIGERCDDLQEACRNNTGPVVGDVLDTPIEDLFQIGIMHDGRSMISYLAGETKDRKPSEIASLVNIISGGGYGATFAVAKDGKLTNFVNPEDGHQEISPATREQFAHVFADGFQKSPVSGLDAVEPLVAGGKKGYGFHMIWTNLRKRIAEAEAATDNNKELLKTRADKAAKALGVTVEEVNSSILNDLADGNDEITGEQIVSSAKDGDKVAIAITESVAGILARRLVRYLNGTDTEKALKALEGFNKNDLDLLVSGGAGAGIFSVPQARGRFRAGLEPAIGHFERSSIVDRMMTEELPDDGALLRARAAASALATKA